MADHAASPLAMQGSLIIAMDRRTGLICVEGKGVWTEEQVLTHFQNLAFVTDQMRRRHGLARVLIDVSGADAQSDGIGKLICERNLALYDASDRVAMLVAEALRTPDMKPIADAPGCRLFDDPDSARAWLAEA